MTDDTALRGKVAVVTGAASGIGLAVATHAASRGMTVVMADVETARLREAARTLSEAGAKAIEVTTDVSSADQVDELARVAERVGAPWLVVNNAGVGLRKRTWDITLEDWNWVLGVNLFGVVNGIRAFLPGLLERNEGHIVNTASMAGLVVGASSSSPYAASKHAVVGLSEVLYRELEALNSGVHVSVLCPGPVTTDIAFAGRNRPDRFGGPALPPGAFDGSRHGDASLAPERVAEALFRAVRDARFWVLTHTDRFGAPIVLRMKGAVDGRNPDSSTLDPVIAGVPWDAGTLSEEAGAGTGAARER